MKPNGMRAWRRLAKRWRRKQNRHNRETGAAWIADGTGRWYRRQQAFFKQRPTVHAPAFRTWSLVGMTMGARKRAALRDALHNTDTAPAQLTKREASIVWSSFSPAVRDGMRAWRQAVRTKYRIGERLRPCPNPFCSKEDGCALRQCHGSGVLPARGQR